MSEQEIITKYFSRHQSACENVKLSIGDDAAIVIPPDNTNLVITTDTLNLDVHFFANTKPEWLGHKSLAVSLSDIAAMGASPLWATLSLSLPEVNHSWLAGFANGLYKLADEYNVKLIGGDLVKGPLSITIQIIGCIETNRQLLRSTCQIGDLIYVSGTLGDAAFAYKLVSNKGIEISQEQKDYFSLQLHKPMPRLDVSKIILPYATAAIDCSDGFLIDLQRMLSMSQKGAFVDINNLPISDFLNYQLQHDQAQIEDILIGGEDYELIFTIKPSDQAVLEEECTKQKIKITNVGKTTTGSKIEIFNQSNPIQLPEKLGFDHFS